MAGVLLPFLKWVIGGSGSKGPKLLNFVVRSPWSTIDVVGEVRDDGYYYQLFPFIFLLLWLGLCYLGIIIT